jgi:uncharacterized membrane protein YkgB
LAANRLSGIRIRQRKHQQCRSPAGNGNFGCEAPDDPIADQAQAGRNRHVLFAARHVGHRKSAGLTIERHLPERLSGSDIESGNAAIRDLDYHLIRASMVLIFLAFGYQKWFAYEAQVLIPYISHGPLIFWLYPVFGIRGASWFLGVSEWLFGALLFLGFWNKRLGILGAIGSTATFVGTVTIIPFMPNGWDPVAGFPAMAGNVPFLMKDVVLLGSVDLLLEAGCRARPRSQR